MVERDGFTDASGSNWAALQWNKRSLTQTYETMGFSAAMQYGLEACVMLDVIETPEGKKFKEIQKADGLTAAIRWHDTQFAPFEYGENDDGFYG